MTGFENFEDVVRFAIEKEKEAADFYVDCAGQEIFSGSRQMLLDFAKEEHRHGEMLQRMLAQGATAVLPEYDFKWIPDIRRSDYVADIAYRPGLGYHELLMVAMKREEKALKLYNLLQEKGVRKVFKILCQEEAKHKLALESMYDDYMAKMGD
jgi:rubrerythrin